MYERIKVNTLSEYKNVLDIYEVDKYGNVYGKNGIELKQNFNSVGYRQIRLKIKNERRWQHILTHRLVGFAFVKGYSENRQEIDHIDGNKLNNHYKNLRWVNRFENINNPVSLKNRDEGNKRRSKQCYVYDFLLNFIGEFDSISAAQKVIKRDIKELDVRIMEYYVLSTPDLSKILEINRKKKLNSIVITDIETHQKTYFYSNREARRFFDGKVNITQAIQKNWTVKGRYKVRNINYKKLIDMLDL